MGIDRIIGVEFRKPQRLEDVILPFEACFERFGMHLPEFSYDLQRNQYPGSYIVSWSNDPAPFYEQVSHLFPKAEAVVQFVKQNPQKNWHLSFGIRDSQNREFGSTSIRVTAESGVTRIRMDMWRQSLLFGYRVTEPDDRYHPDKVQYLKEWNEFENTMVEHERQEYHFMRTLFEMLPDAVQLDLFRNCDGIEDPDYCFTREGARPDAWCKEKRWPELEKWCDEHEPEYWQQFAPKS